MPYLNITIPTYADLEPQIVAWAAARELVHPDGAPLKATPMAQHAKTVEEIGEAALELRKLARTRAIADRLVNRLGCPSLASLILKRRKHRLSLEFGDVFVTLGLQAAMHGSALEQCKVESGHLNGMPTTWEYVDSWAEKMRIVIDCMAWPETKEAATVSAIQYIGAIARCTEDIARVELSLMGPECLVLALEKIAGRTGEVVDGQFVKAGVTK